MQNETIQSLQKAMRMKDNIIERMGDVMSAMVDDKLEAEKAMTRFKLKQDDLERRLLALETKQPRIEREVSRFEKLNNANEWGKP